MEEPTKNENAEAGIKEEPPKTEEDTKKEDNNTASSSADPTSDGNVKSEEDAKEEKVEEESKEPAKENAIPKEEPITTATKQPDEDAGRKTWDHSNRKVMVKNTLKFLDKKKLKKLVDSWIAGTNVKVHKTRKPPKDNWIVLTLESEEQVQTLIDHMNNNNFLNKKGERVEAVRVGLEGGDEEEGDHRKRKRDDEDLTRRQKSRRDLETFVPRVVTPEEIKDKMLPLWKNTYQEQLAAKMKELVRRSTVKIHKEIKAKFRQIERESKKNPNCKPVQLYEWVKAKRPIEVEPILHAKDIVRNKVEFTFGPKYIKDESKSQGDAPMEEAAVKTEEESAAIKTEEATATTNNETNDDSKDAPMEDATTDTKEPEADDQKNSTESVKMIPSLGCMARGWSGGVSHPKCCRNMPSEAIAVADIVEEFLQDCPMPPYDAKVHRGFWRTLTIRSSRRTKECMLIFVHAPPTGGAGSKDSETVDNYAPEVFESEKARLVSMLTGKDLPVIPVKLEEDNEDDVKPESFLQVTSIFFQEFDGISMPPPEHPVQHVYGVKAITEKLGKCTFQISPGAFFQVNTQTAEVLYNVVVEKVREVATNPADTLCFDVCCGTGTIGLTLMKEGVVGKIVGIDISAPAIEDAKVNANLNGLDYDDAKTSFVAAPAQKVMQQQLRKVQGSDGKVVAVVDPAREGLHADVLRSLRAFDQIDRLVYVSCNPTGSLIQDSAVLCCPPSKRYRGRPFRPTFAQPVDMFPYSSHCELVMVFDRMTDEELGDNVKE